MGLVGLWVSVKEIKKGGCGREGDGGGETERKGELGWGERGERIAGEIKVKKK